eukprot:4771292-Amphidinium_carterae.1
MSALSPPRGVCHGECHLDECAVSPPGGVCHGECHLKALMSALSPPRGCPSGQMSSQGEAAAAAATRQTRLVTRVAFSLDVDGLAVVKGSVVEVEVNAGADESSDVEVDEVEVLVLGGVQSEDLTLPLFADVLDDVEDVVANHGVDVGVDVELEEHGGKHANGANIEFVGCVVDAIGKHGQHNEPSADNAKRIILMAKRITPTTWIVRGAHACECGGRC